MFDLFAAVEKGDLKTTGFLISNGANIEIKDNNGATPLHIASGEGHLKILEILISHGSCIFYQNYYMHDPLIYSPQVNEYLLFKIDDLN